MIVPDLPGSGHSAPLPSWLQHRRLGGALWACAITWARARCIFVGFSLGGAVSLEMALQRPAQRAALGAHQQSCQLSARPLEQVARSGADARSDSAARHAPRGAACRETPVSHALATDAARTRRRGGERGAAGQLPSDRTRAAVVDGVERLHLSSPRALVIAAENDFTPLAEKRALAARARRASSSSCADRGTARLSMRWGRPMRRCARSSTIARCRRPSAGCATEPPRAAAIPREPRGRACRQCGRGGGAARAARAAGVSCRRCGSPRGSCGRCDDQCRRRTGGVPRDAGGAGLT